MILNYAGTVSDARHAFHAHIVCPSIYTVVSNPEESSTIANASRAHKESIVIKQRRKVLVHEETFDWLRQSLGGCDSKRNSDVGANLAMMKGSEYWRD